MYLSKSLMNSSNSVNIPLFLINSHAINLFSADEAKVIFPINIVIYLNMMKLLKSSSL